MTTERSSKKSAASKGKRKQSLESLEHMNPDSRQYFDQMKRIEAQKKAKP